MSPRQFPRRRVLSGIAAAALAGCARVTAAGSGTTVTSGATRTSGVPKRPLGRTGVSVSALALGGYHLGSARDEATAIRIVHEAIDHGVTFLDNAWEYHEGKSEEWMGKALIGKRDQVFLMTKVCSHGRDAKTAMTQLEDSLRRLRTDHIDLWQIHEVIHDNDPELHYRADGAIAALDRARSQGKVRFVGFTGHKDPSIHLKMLSFGYPFDAVQLPLNCMDATFRSFERHVLPVLAQKNVGAVGMKAFGGTGDMLKKGIVRPDEALRYVLSLPIASVVSGIDSLEVLRQNLRVCDPFTPMTAEEMQALRARVAVHAGDGRFELYKTSKRFDGKPGREQHGFPDESNLAM